MTRGFVSALKAAIIALPIVVAAPAFAADGHGGLKPTKDSWSFSGPFGHFDRAQIQRGFQVYREVCASCHAMSLVSFRNLMEEGGPQFTEGQVRALAAEYKVMDGPDDSGEMFERPARPSDRFPSPFPNEAAARSANGGAYPPDFSLLAKARGYERGFPWVIWDLITQYQEHGVDYIHSLMTAYGHEPPNGEEKPGLHYNPVFPGGYIAMPNPLSDGQIEYADGSPATVDQYSRDVAAFMMWAAEPHLEARKRIGFQVMAFLAIFAALMYYTKRKVWSDVAH
ncbi:cytochrome c1 [Terrihabitans sp. B22-R8]|uniref:cytochrome c1 n=1 Tax=Terrihabitans sp. B22-R8 TaxID=3425128 RepID=UPI00403C0146